MDTLPLLLIASGLCWIGFAWSIFRRGSGGRRNVLMIVLLLLVSLGMTVAAGVVFGRRTFSRLKDAVAEIKWERTGDEIYASCFGPPRPSCVRVIRYKDQLMPRLDSCIWLELTTCPSEIARINRRGRFNDSVCASSDSSTFMPAYGPRPAWFLPQELGDSVRVLRDYTPDNPNRDRILFLSTDSTHAFFCDMSV